MDRGPRPVQSIPPIPAQAARSRIWSAYQQAVFDQIEHGHNHLVVIARAGSGKTTTLVEAVKRCPPHASKLVVAFNKTIAAELNRRLQDPKIFVRTFHQLGLAAIGRDKRFQTTLNSEKELTAARTYLEEQERFEDPSAQYQYAQLLARIADLVKNVFVTNRADLVRLIEDFAFDEEHDSAVLAEDAAVVIKRTIEDTSCVSFSDMIFLPVLNNMRMFANDYVFVDELQDVSSTQLQLVLKACRGRFVGFGDDRQCHPPGTMIELTGGRRIPIERVRPGDQVVSYHDCFRGTQTQGRTVEACAHRQYTGELIRVRAGREAVVMTPNHRVPTRLRYDRDRWAIYVMETGETSRIGSCKLNYQHSFGPAMRTRQERADRMWVLAVYEDEEEARIQETVLAARYGLPERVFFEKGKLKQRLLNALGNNRLQCRAVLRAFGRDYDYPLYEKGRGDRIGRYVYITQACNLLEGVNELRTFDGTALGGAWEPVQLSRYHGRSKVYSLKVAPTEGGHRLYVADRVLVHNSIYQFRGADSRSIERVQQALKADRLPLTISYRCPERVLKVARQYVPDIEAAPGALQGSVKHVSLEQALGLVRPGDFILSRTNAACSTVLAALRDCDIAAQVLGDVGLKRSIDACLRRSKTRDLNVLREFLERDIAAKEEKFKQRPDAAEKATEVPRMIANFLERSRDYRDLETWLRTAVVDEVSTRHVMLSTTHKIKGAEFDRVFVLRETFLRRPGPEEENLMYVAVTRAKKELVLVTSGVYDAQEKVYDSLPSL